LKKIIIRSNHLLHHVLWVEKAACKRVSETLKVSLLGFIYYSQTTNCHGNVLHSRSRSQQVAPTSGKFHLPCICLLFFLRQLGPGARCKTGNDPENANGIKQAAEFARDDATVQNLRNQYNADLVICFIGNEYDDGIGYATGIPANNADYCATVTAPFASNTANFTFTHELGHLLGGRHELNADAGPPPYSHGFQFSASGSNSELSCTPSR